MIEWEEYLSMWASLRAGEWSYANDCNVRIRRLVRATGECRGYRSYDAKVGWMLRKHQQGRNV